MFDFLTEEIPNQEIELPALAQRNIRLSVKREDRIHPYISGNKYRKLKYNLLEARKLGKDHLLSFGGAYSNHIAAVAAAGKEEGFRTTGVIRGEELEGKIEENPTLSYAASCGMKFKFISRTAYRDKTSDKFLQALRAETDDFFLIPEGGTNELAVKGCEEILTEKDAQFNYICSSIGTGGTIAGLINCSKLSQQVLGFPALKGSFLQEDIRKFASKDNWKLIDSYHFGGYAKVNTDLVQFMNDFKTATGILLDPVYTGKMMYGILDLVKEGYFKEGSRILAIHTGGIQGIPGMNSQLVKRGLPIIEI
ncbi:pyridoxal-phosphate dependent enzyme [Leptobacterium flavescens]|uniref:Pyridoxal-phosphate dependent enzyme n=1 Tax=Leptobacterium flavescens TaxID=472055 RepID=A0A6P0UPP2_9FLAO|nr:pyridoxal-phosphate dependent enzyme [Leptobacterium flavescens]NER14927.1 pyridoxal-phosphate dependent enzyme [Leptobacterium flavescens]